MRTDVSTATGRKTIDSGLSTYTTTLFFSFSSKNAARRKYERWHYRQLYTGLSDPCSWLFPWTPRVVCTMTFLSFLIVSPVFLFWPETCPRNLTRFAFWALTLWLTLRDLWVCFWPRTRLWGYHSPRVTYADCHTSPSLLSLSSSRRVPPLLTPSLVLFPQRFP
jgi:hypothetical protein